MSFRRSLPTLLLGVLLLAGCGRPVDDVEPPIADPPTEDVPTADPPGGGTDDEQSGGDEPMPEVGPLVADWERDDVVVELPGGWRVQGCEGDAPLLCVVDGERQIGFLELGRYPLPDAHDGDDRAYLASTMDGYVEGMRADRAAACPYLEFEAIPAIDRSVGGAPGLRGGFRLVDADGREVERHVVYWAVSGGEHVTVTVPAYTSDGCLEPMGEFTPEDLGLVARHLDALVADTPIPTTAAG